VFVHLLYCEGNGCFSPCEGVGDGSHAAVWIQVRKQSGAMGPFFIVLKKTGNPK